MPEIKNIFVGAKMNKDLNPRMISNKEYIDARNAAVINSEGSDSGLLQNVSGNALLTDFGLTGINLEVVGFYIDTTNNRLFAFITDWNDVSNSQLSNFASQNSHHYICVFDTSSNAGTVLVSGSFLNFSKTHPILGINLLEDLLFFTDNRNQPRKINIKTALVNPNYYSKEEHISVAKYYPYNAPRLVKDKGDGSLLVNSTFKITSNVTNITDSAPFFTTGTFTVSPAGGSNAGFRIVSSGDKVLSVAAVVITGNEQYYVGEDFSVGDEITIPSGTLAGQVGDLVFVVSGENMAKEGTMKDVVSKNLPATETLTVDGAPASLTEFDYSGTAIDSNWIGSTITATESDGTTPVIRVSDNIKITNIVGNTITHDSFSALSNTDIVTVGANPYYDAAFDGDSNFLTDKFARFSYRFKYDDGEYSLIAPFSQIAFIPKQDGYFLEESVPENIDSTVVSDENKAIKSTIISFFENKVNLLELVINMPEGVNTVSDLINDLKVSEIDIVYKQSDQNTIKVIDTINRDSIVTNLNSNLVYTYDSQLPIKTLPANETTRASDKVPIRAKSQEVASNRVMYGNYLVRTARPNSLDYSISCSEKSELGQLNSVNEIEYPNHTLKQNRSYKVGIVLADKFGRQSDVITSLNSTVYNPYIGINPDYIINPDGISTIKTLGQIYRGDSLKTTFLLGIPEQISASGYAGLYSETNPTGWYSYKIVVQQREQEYYNVYLPTILNNNPQSASIVSKDTAFITLFSDNINKVPRDLKEVGPQQLQFSSSADLYLRVSNSSFITAQATNKQVATTASPDKVVLIGTRNEIGLNKTADGGDYNVSPFYSIPSTITSAGPPIVYDTTDLGANPYIGKVATRQQAGATGGYANAPVTFENVRLNVYETQPFESVLDIYYETGDSGLIADLNEDVKNNDLGLVPAEISDWTFVLNENYVSDQLISTTPFDVLNFQGVSLTSLYGADVSVEILQVVNENDVILDPRIFKVVQQTSAPFKFELKTGDIPAEFVYRSPNNSYSILFKLINTNSGFDYTNSYNIPIGLNRLANSPIIETTGASIEGNLLGWTTYNGLAFIGSSASGKKQIKWNSVGVTPLYPALDISTPNQWVTLQDFEFENGASFDLLQDTDLYVQYFGFTQGPLYFMNPGSVVSGGGLFFDGTRDYTDKLRIRKIFDGSTIKYRLEYSEKLRPYNDRATTLSQLYQEPPPNTESDFLVQLTLADATTGTGNSTVRLAGSLGMSTANIDDSASSLFVYQFKLQN